MRIIQVAIVIIQLSVLTACTTSKKTSSRLLPDAASQHHTKILLLGIVPREQMQLREELEIKMEESFQHEKINAVSSLKLLGTAVFDRMDEEDALYQLNNNCIDAVMTVSVLKRAKENRYTAGLIHDTPFNYYYDRFWRYRTAIKNRMGEAEYFDDGSGVFIECNLYDMITQKLVYSAQSHTFNTQDYNKITGRFVQKMTRELFTKTNKKHGLAEMNL